MMDQKEIEILEDEIKFVDKRLSEIELIAAHAAIVLRIGVYYGSCSINDHRNSPS